MDTYELVVPQKGRAYRLNAAALTACREAIRAEAGDKAVFRDGSYSWTVGKQISSSSIRIITGCFPTMPTKRWIRVTSDSSHATISLETPGSAGTAKTGNEFLNP